MKINIFVRALFEIQPRKERNNSYNFYSVPSLYVMDWIYLAQNRDSWQVLMNTIMSLGVP